MLTFDIETYKDISDPNYIAWKTSNIPVGNRTDPVKIAAYQAERRAEMQNEFALSPLTGKIILIGCLTDNELVSTSDIPFQVKLDGKALLLQLEGDEKDILTKFWQVLWRFIHNDGGQLVSFNGKMFDLPFIIHRSTILNIELPGRIMMNRLLNKYNNDPHVDLFNWFNGGSLVEWSYKLGLTSSLAREGNQIGVWYEAGQMQLIKEKNSIDLFQTATIYNKIKNWL